ncbi:MAG: DUF4126 family protein [Sphingobacteriales bacterium]
MKIKKISHPFWQALGIGTLAGMRTSSAPAITSQILSHHQSKALKKSPLNFMQSKTVANTLAFLTVGEVIIDKLPSTPNRIKPAGFTFRCLSGALAGASIYKATGGNVLTGALLGSASAAASTYLSFILRKNAVKKTKIFDPIIGAIEDALVMGAGVGLIQIA